MISLMKINHIIMPFGNKNEATCTVEAEERRRTNKKDELTSTRTKKASCRAIIQLHCSWGGVGSSSGEVAFNSLIKNYLLIFFD